MTISLLPESAPFTEDQRAWLNGFFAGLLGLSSAPNEMTAVVQSVAAAILPGMNGSVEPAEQPAPEIAEDFPWHDPALPLSERLQLAAGKPKERQLMAALAQLNCGACGYVCQTYSEALANGSETNLKLCSPGGAETAKALKRLVALDTGPAASATDTPSAFGSLTVELPAKVSSPAPSAAPSPSAARYSRANPFPARLVSSTNLNAPGSEKHTSHVVLDLSGSGLRYEVGDSLGVFPRNCPEYVTSILAALRADAALPLVGEAEPQSLFDRLMSVNLRDVDERHVEALLPFVEGRSLDQLQELLADEDRLAGLDLLDLLELCPGASIDVSALVSILAPLTPRLYSIASSQRVHPDQVHLTVGRATRVVGQRLRKGVASTMFSDRVVPGDSIPVFVQPSHCFKLPADPSTPVIMVGPGTGIAPFRAFLQERRATGARGGAWLFFGDQRSATDFLYAEEWRRYLSDGTLTRLNTAFSRDQESKIYVQHRLLEQGEELFRWLERGASFYVCGDARRMAADVHQALCDVVAEYGDRSHADAKDYVDRLSKTQRYLRDVY